MLFLFKDEEISLLAPNFLESFHVKPISVKFTRKPTQSLSRYYFFPCKAKSIL